MADQIVLGSPDLESFAGARGRVRPTWSPTWIAVVACLILGTVSVLTLPSLPGYDVFAWIVWGRELAHHVIGPTEPFIVGGGPSWKPLPVVFTVLFGFFGAAPKLWVALARAAGLFGLFVAYRLGARLGASPRWRLAGPLAGVLAAFGVFLTSGWTHYMLRATSEPMVVQPNPVVLGGDVCVPARARVRCRKELGVGPVKRVDVHPVDTGLDQAEQSVSHP